MKDGLGTFLGLVFGLVLGLTLISYIANTTILQSKTVIAAVPAGTFPAIAKALPQALGQLTPISSDEKIILAQQIDPGLVRQISDSVITQEIQYLHGKGRSPQLNLQILSNRLRLEGAPLPQALYSRLDQPISLQSDTVDRTAVPVVGWLDRLRILGPIISLALAGLIWVLGSHLRYRSLAKGSAAAALVLALSLALVQLLPSLASSGLTTSPLVALAAPIKAALRAMTGNYIHQATRAILALLAAMLVLVVAHVLLGRKPKHHR